MTRLFSLVAYYYAVYINNHIMSNDENVRPTLMVRKVQVMNQHIIVKRSNIFGYIGYLITVRILMLALFLL